MCRGNRRNWASPRPLGQGNVARDELKAKAEQGGFVEYGPEQLPKVNTQRRDMSQPDFYGVPILSDSEVMLCTASQIGNKPASCYTCQIQQSDRTCGLLGPIISVTKFRGHKDSGEQIEYWPCCDEHDYGQPQSGKPSYRSNLSTPDQVGLIWINAPELGQPFGGANCGGINGGDDCDRYRTRGRQEKWDADTGLCTVLQHEVDGGAVCTAWHDDDIIRWQDAQQLMKGDSVETMGKAKLVKSIMGRDDSDEQ